MLYNFVLIITLFLYEVYKLLTIRLANEIVEQTMLRLKRNVNVMSIDGIILASGDKERVEKFHEGAKFVAESKKTLIISDDNIHDFPQTKHGINLPIFFQEEIVCIIGITGVVDEELLNISSLVQLTAEVLVHQALIESKSEWQRKMSVHIFEELISGTSINRFVKERINKLAIPFIAPYCIILLKAEQKTGSHRTLIQYIDDFFYNKPVIFGHFQLDEYFILTTELNQTTLTKIVEAFNTYIKSKFSIKIAVGEHVENLERLPHSYKTAQLALKHHHTVSKVIYHQEVEVFTLFNPEVAHHYSIKTLNQLDDKLIATLQCFFNNNKSASATADELQIHRHTLAYRLSQIKEQTFLNPAEFHDALKLQIALWHREGLNQ